MLAGMTAAGAKEPAVGSSASRLQTDAYLAMARADAARDAGETAAAAAGYRDALDQYQALREKYPDRQGDIVAYRIRYCSRELNALLPDPPAPVSAGPGTVPEQTLQALQRQNRLLQQRLRELEREKREWEAAASQSTRRLDLQTARVEELGTQVREAHDLRRRIEALQKRNRELELALKGAEQEAETRNDMEEERRVFAAKVRLLQEQCAEAQSDRAVLGEEYAALEAELQAARDERVALEGRVAASQRAAWAAEQQVEAMRQREALVPREVEEAAEAAAREELEVELAGARRAIAEAEGVVADLRAALAATGKSAADAVEMDRALRERNSQIDLLRRNVADLSGELARETIRRIAAQDERASLQAELSALRARQETPGQTD